MVKAAGIKGVPEQETTLDFVRLDNGREQRVDGQRWSSVSDATAGRRTTEPVRHGENGTDVVCRPLSKKRMKKQNT